jgi:metal-sulfur cluster biosynthetic enzyme
MEGVGHVVVNIVWDPAWTPDRMSVDAHKALGFG